jgi:RNA polymerase sigma-70 factor (ECF subfamily)
MDTPPSLLERLRVPGDPQGWPRFVQLYTPLLYFWARGAGLQEADASDLVQGVLVQLFQVLPEFADDRRQSFRSWLCTVTLNKWRERLRRRAPAAGANSPALAEVPGLDPLGELEETEYRSHLVQQALLALQDEFPVTTWKAYQQYVIAGRPVEEVAAALGVGVGTVYAAKSRVLARLRRELNGLLDE